MGKKSCWFTYMRKLLSITKTKPKSKESTNKEDLKKNWRWFSEIMFKFKHDSPAPQHPWKTLNEATEEQRKHALAVAKATAAAAEAAVAAANAATEVVRLTNRPFELEKKIKYLAAVRIQCAYRGHLARKALSALKGLVKLQAVIRGELMRRKVAKTLASMMFSLQPLVREKRALSDFLYHGDARRSISQREGGELKLQRSWDLSLVSKDEIEARYLQKQGAIAKRERMKQYSYSHRELRNDQIIQESVSDTENRRSRRSHRYEEADSLKPLYCSNTIFGTKLKDSYKQETSEASDSPFSQPRRSLCYVKQKSIGDDGSLTIFPTYMSATKSTSAKSRSLSTPRQRLRLHESYSSEYSPREFRLSSLSSIDGEVTKRCKTKSITQHICSTLGTLNC